MGSGGWGGGCLYSLAPYMSTYNGMVLVLITQGWTPTLSGHFRTAKLEHKEANSSWQLTLYVAIPPMQGPLPPPHSAHVWHIGNRSHGQSDPEVFFSRSPRPPSSPSLSVASIHPAYSGAKCRARECSSKILLMQLGVI